MRDQTEDMMMQDDPIPVLTPEHPAPEAFADAAEAVEEDEDGGHWQKKKLRTAGVSAHLFDSTDIKTHNNEASAPVSSL